MTKQAFGGIVGNEDIAPLYERDDVKIKQASVTTAPKETPVLTATRIARVPKSKQIVTCKISAHGMQALQEIAKQYFPSDTAPWVVSNGVKFYS